MFVGNKIFRRNQSLRNSYAYSYRQKRSWQLLKKIKQLVIPFKKFERVENYYKTGNSSGIDQHLPDPRSGKNFG